MRSTLFHLAKRHDVLSFFVLAFAISWACWIPAAMLSLDSRLLLILGSFGPALASIVLTRCLCGRAGLRRMLARLLIWRVGLGWYLFAFLGTAVVVLSSIWIHGRLGGAVPEFNDPGQWYLAIVVFLYVLFFSVMGEEIGWRGYALPRLQARHNALVSSLILGLVWGFWHLPLFWIKGNEHQQLSLTLFILQIVAQAIIYTWIYNNTRQSLLMAHLYHAASNATLGLLPILPADTGGDLRPLWIAVGCLWIVTVAIVVIFGPGRLSRGAKGQIDSTGPRTLRARGHC